VWRKNAPQPSQRSSAALPRETSPWHAVSINGKAECCPSSRALLATRFLSRDAPRLPLAQCSMADGCQCFYQHHGDRRGPARRRAEAGLGGANHAGHERRAEKGRRRTDAPMTQDLNWYG